VAKDVKTQHIGDVRVEVEHKTGILWDSNSVLAVNEKTGKTTHVEMTDRQAAIDTAVKRVR
jgi:hypothetical protein